MVDSIEKEQKFYGGKLTPEKRAKELIKYCNEHIEHENQHGNYELYRILYYDCPPLEKTIYHPLLKRGIDMRHSETYAWTNDFYAELIKNRKVALRMGELSEQFASYSISPEALKKLCAGNISIGDLEESDFSPSFQQKGVDMKIGLDIASLSYKKLVDQIILIAGDSDFVPAAKLARREGIDFVLDPMWSKIKDSLFEHIDGLRSQWKPNRNQ